MQSLKLFRKGQKVRHKPSGKILEVIRDEGGVKVLVKVKDQHGESEMSIPRYNLEEVEE